MTYNEMRFRKPDSSRRHSIEGRAGWADSRFEHPQRIDLVLGDSEGCVERFVEIDLLSFSATI